MGLIVKFWDFPRILELFIYWKLCRLGAWAVDRDLVSVHHGLAEVMMMQFAGDGCASNLGCRDLVAGVWEARSGSSSSCVSLCGGTMGVGQW
jgi:hypothetical protein